MPVQLPMQSCVRVFGQSWKGAVNIYICADSLGIRDGWLVAWGLCGCMLIRFSAVWLLPFTLL